MRAVRIARRLRLMDKVKDAEQAHRLGFRQGFREGFVTARVFIVTAAFGLSYEVH